MLPAATMRNPTSSLKHNKKPSKISNNSLSASIELLKGAVAVGETLPVAGNFVKGLAGAAVVFLENLERLEKNKDDIQVLAREITEVVIIVRDAAIKMSGEPESIKYVEDLKIACLEFQKFLSDLTTQVIDIERNNVGSWKDIRKLLASRDVQEKINGYRRVMEGARSNLLLSLNLISSTSMTHVLHGVASLQSSQTDLTTIACDIQRDIRARPSTDDKFHNLVYGDIRCRDMWWTNGVYRVVDNKIIEMGQVSNYAADVSTSNRVFVIKEYSGSAGLQKWERDFQVHRTAPRHPNLRQLYGVITSVERPCLVFHGTIDEVPFYKFPTLFDKHLIPLIKSVLYYRYCSVLKFAHTHWGVTFNEMDLRCAPDGRLVFDEVPRFSWNHTWYRIYVNDFEDIIYPVPPAVEWSLKLLMLQREGPTILKEHLSAFYRIMTVGAPCCIFPDVEVDIVDSTLLGTFIVSDLQERRHFTVDCLGEEIPPVKLSVESCGSGELLEVRDGLWRFIRTHSPVDEEEGRIASFSPEEFNFLGLGFICSVGLTSETRSQHLASWFSQGPRILAKISERLKDQSPPDLIVSHVIKRRFYIRLLKPDSEEDSDSQFPDIPYIFIDLPFMQQDAKNHSITLPVIYLSSDPHGAKPGADCEWRKIYKLEVIDMGDSYLFVSRVNLETACCLQERCGLRAASLDTASLLNQRELTFQAIDDEAITNTLSEEINTSVRESEEDYPTKFQFYVLSTVLLEVIDESVLSAGKGQ